MSIRRSISEILNSPEENGICFESQILSLFATGLKASPSKSAARLVRTLIPPSSFRYFADRGCRPGFKDIVQGLRLEHR